MKKFLPLLILAIMSLARGTCVAFTGVHVADILVDAQNASNITGPGISGTVSYDIATRTLTLRNAIINCPNTHGITSDGDLTIVLIGNNQIICSRILGEMGINCLDLTINGPGHLYINSNFGGIVCDNLTVQGGAGINIEDHSTNYAVRGYGNCTVTNSTMSLRCDHGVSLFGFDHLILNNTSLTNYTRYDEYRRVVFNTATGSPATMAQIAVTEYDLYVAGMRVNALNQNNINSVFSGTASYNPTTKTLTLRDVDINTPGNGIETSIDGFKLNLEGSNRIISQDASGIVFGKNCTVTGSGSLRIEGDNGFITESEDNPSLILTGGCAVNIFEASYGISIPYGNVQVVLSELLTQGSTSAVLCKDFYMKGTFIYTPFQGATFHPELGTFCYNNTSTPLHALQFKPGLHVGGKLVTTANAAHITGNGITGLVSFEPSTNTLTLNNATIAVHVNDTKSEIENEIDGLTIKLIGTNTIQTDNSTYCDGIKSNRRMTIEGNEGVLNISEVRHGIWMENHLTLQDDCEVNVTSNSSCFKCSDFAGSLTFSNSSAHLQASNAAAISGWSTIYYQQCDVVYPANFNNDYSVHTISIEPEAYDIWVAGNRVTWRNRLHVTGEGIEGLVSYSEATNTLTLNNATINYIGEETKGIVSNVDGLNIVLIGDNTINSSLNGVYIDADHTTFSGSGRLTVNADNGIWVDHNANRELTFTGGCNVIVNATNGVGVYNSYGEVAVNQSELRAKGTFMAIGCSELNLTETSITAPYGASFNSIAGAVTYQGTNEFVKNEYVVISASPYNLWVQGTQVTVSNAFDVLGDGTVSYDATQKTLTLRDAVLTSNTAEGIYNEIPNLNIVIEGTNTINAYTAGIFSAVDCNIRGKGTLNVSGNDGIKSLANLTISGPCQVNATANGSGAHAAILGATGMSLTINQSYVSTICAQGIQGPIYGFSNFYTNDCVVWAPDNTVWNSNTRRFEKKGRPVITAIGVHPQVVIAPNNLNLYIGSNRVTCQNASNITGDGIVSGTISFNPLNKELVFDNVTVTNQMPGRGAVDSNLDGLSIKLIGNNSFTSPLGIAFYALNTTITGSGYLTLDAAYGIVSSDLMRNTLSIENGCEITILHAQEGVSCPNCDVVIDASKLNIKNAQTFAFQAHSLSMNNVYIAEPVGASFNTKYRGVCYSGTSQYVTNLVIAPEVYNLWIGNDQVTRENAAHFTSSSVTGTIQYDAINNVLTLNNASINIPNINALRSMMPTLTINLIGTNSIDAEGIGIWSDEGCNLIIKGANGTLTVAGSRGIDTGGDLTICDGCTVNATGTARMAGYGICSYSYDTHVQYSGTMLVLNSIVNVKSSQNYIPAIDKFEHLVLRGCEFVSPDDAVWDDEGHQLDNTSHFVISQLSIAPHPYSLMVNGIQVNAANATDILGDGTISYDPDENILTLENANIVNETPLVDGIVNNIEGLRINLIGNNTINVTNYGLYLGSVNTTVLGHGTLNITAAIGVSTSATSNNTLTVTDGCEVSIHALSGNGIYLPYGTLAINGSALNSTGHNPYASVACNALSMTGVSITQPNNAQFWGGEVHYSQGTEPVCTQVSFSPNPYDLWVAETQVTFANCYDVLEDGGSVSYDAQNNVLTLNNASISLNNSGDGIKNEINGLRINLVGYNSISTNSGSCVYTVSANLTISGRGELYATAPVAAITARASHLTIEGGCTVNAFTTGGSSYSAIRGVDAPNSLTITNSTVYATAAGSSQSAIAHFYGFTLNGCTITTPVDAVWDNGVESNGNPATVVMIEPDVLGLIVDGIQVTTDIADDVLGDGTVSYDVANNVLTLNNAHLTHSYVGVDVSINDMTIKLVGSNTISASQYGINAFACNHLVVEGPGILSVDSTINVIEVSGTLEIQGGCSIYANACDNGIYNPWSGGNLYITNSSVYILDANFYPFVGFDDCILNGCSIISPEGAVWNDELSCIFDADGQVAKSVTIEPYAYDLWVAGVHVTSAIADDILGDGKVIYNSIENTLTLNNASIITEDELGILNKIENLTVKLLGDNTISANSPSYTAGIGSQEDITIEGPGTLEVSGAYAIMVEGNLTIEGVRGMTATASGYRYYSAIQGNMDNSLTIINSDVKAFALNSADNGAISDFEDMILEGCYISSPDYANYNTTDQYVWAEGNPVDSVYISPNPYNLWVAGIQVTTANADDILGNGKVRFDASNNVLVLDNVTFSNEEPNGVGIMNKIDGLTIVPVGLCSVTGNAMGIHSLNRDLVIDGQGWLLVYGKEGIVVENAYLNVQGGCQLEATATGANYYYAIVGSLDYAFTVTNSSVVAKANNPVGSTIYGFSNLSLDGCYIMTPEGAIWNSSSRALELDGNTVTTEVRIKEVTYPLVVNDIQVSSSNYSNVLGDGSVSYDPDTHTLTLNNVSMENHYGNGHSGTAIKNEGVDNLIIVLYGDNTISADEGIAMGDYAATITGPGTLSIDAEWGYGIMSNMYGAGDLTVYGVPSLEINAYYAGIKLSSSLYVTNSEMKVTGSVDGSISCGGYPWFQGCQITEPADASWQYVETMGIWKYYVCNSAMEIITDQVVISPEDYHMWVGGVAVTSVNCSDVLGDGTVCYEPMMNTLTLNNADIVCMEEDDYFAAGIRYQSEWPGAYLNVVLIGNNSITAGYYGINIGDANVNIGGDGYLYIEAPCGIYGDDVLSVAQIYGSTVEINATNSGVLIYDGTLSVQYGELRATGSSGASIMCATLSLEGSRIMTPEGAEFNADNHRVELNNAAVKTQVVIRRDVYNLYVAGVQVTLDNAANITGEGISGSVSYDIDNNVLILNNATITTAYQGIQNYIPNLTIRIIGTNTITVNSNTGINTSDDMIFDGSGILNLTGSDAIIAQMNLTIQGGCSLNLTATGTGSYSGIWGNDSYSLNIINSFVRAKSDNTNKGAIYGFGQFNLTGCSVTNPLYVEWDETQHTLINGGSIARDVTISPDAFDLWIGDIRVNVGNANDVFGDGTVSFEPTTSELTLNNATVFSYAMDGIHSELLGITIHLIGVNNITATNEYSDGIEALRNVVIEGASDAVLNTTGRMGLFTSNGDLTIQGGCTVHAIGNMNGRCGIYNYSSTSTLTVSGSMVVAECPGLTSGFISGFDYLVLDDCVITEPEGGYWMTELKRVFAPNNALHERVVISPTPYDLWVAGTRVNKLNASDILGDGKVSYDATNNVLTLNSAMIQSETGYGIQNGIDNLTIVLEGNDMTRIMTPMSRSIYSTGDNMTISGDGRMMTMGGIETTGDLTIMGGCNIMVHGQEHVGMVGTSTHSLTVEGSTVMVDGIEATIMGYGSLQLRRAEVVEPIGGSYQSTGYVDSNNQLANMVQIQPVAMNIFTNVLGNSWSEASNWSDGAAPSAPGHKAFIDGNCVVDDDVTINLIEINNNASLTVASGYTLSAQTILANSSDDVIVEDGAQLVHGNSGLQATVKKYVRAWNIGAGWNLVSMPTTVTSFANTDLGDGEYDLYRYNETNHEGEEWNNYKETSFGLEAGRGYLYASEEPDNHCFSGTLNLADVTYSLTYTTPQGNYPLAGFNLIGNPYAHNIYKGAGLAIDDENLAEGYYVLNNDGTWQAQTDDELIAPCQAILVCTSAATNLTIANTTAAPSVRDMGKQSIGISVSGNGMNDQVFIHEGMSQSLTKVAHFNAAAPMLFFEESGRDYAIVVRPDVEGQYALCFKAGVEGSYTIGLAGVDRGVVLVDVLTGVEVDLSEGSYTFKASPLDTVERFMLIVK